MNNEELDALITRLKELEDPQKEAVPSFADTDWRTLSGVVAREIESLRQRNDDLVTGLEACDEQVVALRQQIVMLRDVLAGLHWMDTNPAVRKALAATEPK